MVFENRNYVPTLALRASEMNGLEYLPGATKDRLMPCFLLAPWASSNSLEKAVERIQRAFPDRLYFLDLDRDYQFTNLESAAQQEFEQLLLGANGFAKWIEFVRDHNWILPCIQPQKLSEVEIRRQIEAFQDMGRTYCLRIRRDHFPSNIDDLINALTATGSADFAVILEGGWTRDPLTLGLWFSGVISGVLQAIDADIPIVVSCTSIPKAFHEFSGVTPIQFSNRTLLEQISRQSNRTNVIYGDWGSTRPREPRDGGSRPLDRIDYPTAASWYFARNKKDEWDFQHAASAIVDSKGVWDGTLGIWGEEMIFQTTISSALGINTPPKNVAARVNIHLHRQAFFGNSYPDPKQFEEDWKDD